MIEIEEPPDRRACAPCSKPLTWLWSPRTEAWVAFHSDPASTRTLHVHECDHVGRPAPPWRHLEPQHPDTVHAGAALVRAELEKRTNDKPPSTGDGSTEGNPS